MSTTITHSADWHESRRSGIGGSDAPIILGVGLISRYHLWHVKAGEWPPQDLSGNPKVEWGLRHEDTIARKFQDEHPDWKVRRANVMRRSKGYPFAFAHFDRLVWIPGESRPVPFQMKATSAGKDWGPSGSSEIPHYYYPQAQHEIAVADVAFSIEAVLIDGWDYREYRIERNQPYIDQLMADELAFFESTFTGEKPEPTCTDDFLHCYPNPEGTCVDEDGSITKLCVELKALRENTKKLEEKDDALRTQILQKLGAHSRAVTAAKKNVCSVSDTEKVSLREQRKLLEMFPAIEPYSTISQSRRLNLATSLVANVETSVASNLAKAA